MASLGAFGRLPVPMFGSLALAFNFACHHMQAVPRFAPWALTAGVGAGWFVYPALTQNFKASLGFGLSVDDEKALAAASSGAGGKLSAEDGAKVDYSATGALKNFKTRAGARSDFEEGDVDKMPTNANEDATLAIVKAVNKHKGQGIQTIEAVDAIRRFQTRQGAHYEWEAGDIDKTPGKQPAAEAEEEDEEEEDE